MREKGFCSVWAWSLRGGNIKIRKYDFLFLMCLQAPPAKDPRRPHMKLYGQKAISHSPWFFQDAVPQLAFWICWVCPLRKVFFLVNVKFFSLPHKPVLQPFSLEMENVCLKFSQYCAFFAHRNSQLYDMGLGQGYFGKRAFQKQNKKNKTKERQSIPLPFTNILRKNCLFQSWWKRKQVRVKSLFLY